MMRKSIQLCVLIMLFSSLSVRAAGPQSSAPEAQSKPEIVEHGHFQLHKFEQPIGEESYEIAKDGSSLSVKVDFKFTDRGSPVPLSASFRGAQDLTPEAFEIKGRTARPVAIDSAVEVQPGKVRLRDREQWTEVTPPQRFFTIAGYAPTTCKC